MCFSLHGCLAMFSFGNVMGKKVKRLDNFAPFSFFLLLELFPPLQGLGISLQRQESQPIAGCSWGCMGPILIH